MAIQYTLDHGSGPEFYDEQKQLCQQLGTTPIDMLSVWMSESGVHADAHNPNGHASGLNQLMPSTAKGLGWDVTNDPQLSLYRKLSARAQLDWVKKYYTPYAGKLLTVGHLYIATFLPKYLVDGTDIQPDTVLTAKDGPLGWAYEANAVFDENHDYKITVQELVDAVHRNCKGPRWTEIVARATGQIPEILSVETYDLRTIFGLQEALAYLGYYKGPLDNIPGSMTRMAIINFQTAQNLKVDAIPGPDTRGALLQALKDAGVAANG